MIQSKQDYKYYLERDRQASGIPRFESLMSKLQELLFPNYIWQFIKALRYLEYCQNVKNHKLGGVICWLCAKYRYRKISIKLGFSIPPNVFGPGLSLAHTGNIIINPVNHQCSVR